MAGQLLRKILTPLQKLCSSNFDDDDGFDENGSPRPDPCQWSKELEGHSFGEFSLAAVHGNARVEDYGELNTGYGATFAGVYDGHGGDHCARYVTDYLFHHLKEFMMNEGRISGEVLRNAFAATEDGYLDVVAREFSNDIAVAGTGSCALVAVIYNGYLYIANAGDSRAVLGVQKKKITGEQLNIEHNARDVAVRNELRDAYPDIPDIVVKVNGDWRVKGIIQVTRAFGDAHLKRPEFAFDVNHRFYVPVPITRPVLNAKPSILIRRIQPQDRFIILASDGLWDLMTTKEAADVVRKCPRHGIARRLIRRALIRAARMLDGTYEMVKNTPSSMRRTVHDDITVMVIFIDQSLLQRQTKVPNLSVRVFGDIFESSSFEFLETMHASTSGQPPPNPPSMSGQPSEPEQPSQ